MIVSLKIPDATWELYCAHNPTNPRLACEKQIERFKDFSPNDRAVILSHSERRELEGLRQLPFDSGADLVQWVKRLIAYKVGEQDFHLTASQLKTAEGQAQWQKRPLEDVLKDMLQRGITFSLGA